MKNKIKINMVIKLVLLLCLISFPLASSQIIGGEVFTNNTKGINPYWQNVFVYAIEDVNDYVKVMVSPSDNKYMFSNVEPGTDHKLFDDGAVVRAEILDFENGFMAGPTEMILTGENYDIFPKMEFREVVQIKQPNKKLVISKNNSFNIKADIHTGCDFFIKEKNSLNLLCNNCGEYNNSLEGEFGFNAINFIANCHTKKRIKGGSREMIFPEDSNRTATYEKTLIINPTNNNEILINFYGTKSKGIFPITDFIPDEYEVFNVSNNGKVFKEDGYYAIEWKNAYRSPFNYSYYIRPKDKLKNCEIGYGTKDLGYKTWKKGEVVDLKINDFYSECNFSNQVSFQMIEFVNFDSNLHSIIKKNKALEISLNGNLSHNVFNIKFKEYIPKNFEVFNISNGGKLESSTSTHNVIVWNFSGDNFNFNFTIIPQATGDFIFVSELGDSVLEEKSVQVSNFFRRRKRKKHEENLTEIIYKYTPKEFSKVTETFPIIKEDGDVRVAFYSKLFKEKAAFDLFKFTYNGNSDRTLDYIKSYSVETNMGEEEKGNMKFEYKINKSFLKENNYKDIKFKGKKKGNFFTITGGVISSDESTITYGFESPEALSEFFIFAEKSKLNFREELQMFFDKARFYILRINSSYK
ncbi:hypothetical protein KAS08_04350 [Candidatus Pacearchaeota archaeon]|nr:hypothetical protein [Candidatus Pacearchaeota archaeon]